MCRAVPLERLGLLAFFLLDDLVSSCTGSFFFTMGLAVLDILLEFRIADFRDTWDLV